MSDTGFPILPLETAIRTPGFSPRHGDLDALLVLLGGPDKKTADAAERALARLGLWAARQASRRLPEASPPLRARLCRLVGRIAQETGNARLVELLRSWLADPDARTRRHAAIALGKQSGPGIEEALIAAWSSDEAIEQRRAMAAALGKVGGPAALTLLQTVRTDDPELGRIVAEAVLKIARNLVRPGISTIVAERAVLARQTVLFHCRAGLERILAEELGEHLQARIDGEGRVSAIFTGPIGQLYQARTALRFGFPLPVPPGVDADRISEALVDLLTCPETLELLCTFTEGTIRYRIEWASRGHRRADTWRIAREVSRRCPELVNDSRQCLWEVVISGPADRFEVELWPRGLSDPRFSYRLRDVSASSHPTLAAALALIAEVRPDDVVWDPFVGSGLELVERGLLGPYAVLVGTDVEADALSAARENLTASGLGRWELAVADARSYSPARPPTLVITNPPMGRRVPSDTGLVELYRGFLAQTARVLAPSGRLVWISPLPDRTVELARRSGLQIVYRQVVDMNGFYAEIQSFVTPGR